jgi:hypothetical protein
MKRLAIGLLSLLVDAPAISTFFLVDETQCKRARRAAGHNAEAETD